MLNNTIEDYKKGIQAKYEKKFEEGNFPSPSQANLRNLCWEIFERIENPNSNDLTVFRSFFGFEFDLTRRNQFREYKDRFRPIGTFLKAETDPLNIESVELAAVLVDFNPRPFRKFKERGGAIETQPNPGNSTAPQPFVTSDKKKIDFVLEEKELPKVPEPFIVIDEEKSNSKFNEENVNRMDGAETSILPVPSKPNSINLFVNAKEKLIYNFKNRLKKTVAATILVFCLIGAVVYFAFFKKHCMQWSEDHYEVVDCSSDNYSSPNETIPLDENLLSFKKLKACDTTTCFKKNGEAFVWYGKTAKGVDFFNSNGNGRHPENNIALRPVTDYMFNKYLKGKPCE